MWEYILFNSAVPYFYYRFFNKEHAEHERLITVSLIVSDGTILHNIRLTALIELILRIMPVIDVCGIFYLINQFYLISGTDTFCRKQEIVATPSGFQFS